MKPMTKQQFAYDIASNLTGFTDQSSTEILTGSLLGAPTAGVVNKRLNVKGSQNVQIMDSTISVQDQSCGWTSSGTTAFSAVTLATDHKAIKEDLCLADLYDTYQSLLLAPGQNSEDVPFLDQIFAKKAAQIADYTEKKLWQATIAGGDAFDGLKALIVSGATGVGHSAGTAFDSSAAYGTAGNPLYEIDLMLAQVDDDFFSRQDGVIFMSPQNFLKYMSSLTQANFFANYIGGASVTGNMIVNHPNTNIEVRSTQGLGGSNKVVLFPKEYVIFGADLISPDGVGIDGWYSKDFDAFRLSAKWNYSIAKTNFATKYFVTNNLA